MACHGLGSEENRLEGLSIRTSEGGSTPQAETGKRCRILRMRHVSDMLAKAAQDVADEMGDFGSARRSRSEAVRSAADRPRASFRGMFDMPDAGDERKSSQSDPKAANSNQADPTATSSERPENADYGFETPIPRSSRHRMPFVASSRGGASRRSSAPGASRTPRVTGMHSWAGWATAGEMPAPVAPARPRPSSVYTHRQRFIRRQSLAERSKLIHWVTEATVA